MKHEAKRIPAMIEQFAYRGYLVVAAPYGRAEWYISKDGSHIYTAPTMEVAKAEIDGLLD